MANEKKFEADELEHHDIGISHDAEKTPGYKILSKVIELACKTAIIITKKIPNTLPRFARIYGTEFWIWRFCV